MNDAYTKTQMPAKASVTPCCAPEPPVPVACCELICFDRPRYFCGHLLTDADLSLEQKYVIEKNKLYHRSLHGYGVVCGLRLTCDHQCPGHIRIGDGYAIDDCGNDLVVCEPLSFDVLGLLKKKGLLVDGQPLDPCKPEEKQPQCKVRQCFYVTICYQEQPGAYTTPFVAGCRPTISDCEATRVREGVRFDVLPELPKGKGLFDDLKQRLEGCYELLTKGPFAQALKHSADKDGPLTKAVNGKATDDHETYWKLFCTLRGLLLLYLNKHPDKYNCTIEQEIRDIPFPKRRHEAEKDEPNNEQERKIGISEEVDTTRYSNQVRDAFCRLLELANQHVLSCVMGEMIFPCPQPCQASCVVLGTVEVESGQLVRVCNCPRSYIWSFASFFEVLVAELLGGKACESHSNTTDKTVKTEHVCCREFKLNCEAFVKCLQDKQQALRFASTAMLRAIESLTASLRHAFDFTRQDVVLPEFFIGGTVQDARKLAQCLNFYDPTRQIISLPEMVQAAPAEPLETVDKARFSTHNDYFVVREDSLGKIVEVQPQGAIDRLEEAVKAIQEDIAALKKSKSRTRGRGLPTGDGD